MDVCFNRQLIPLKTDEDMDAVASWKANQVAMEAMFIL